MAGPLPGGRLLDLVAASFERGNRALDELARAPGHGLPRQAIAAACFQRRPALVLDALELTIHGYCVLRRTGWTGAAEPVFALGRPPLWRRLLRPAPLLALHVSAHAGGARVSVGPAAPGAAPPTRSGAGCILLEPEQQEALLRSHREHLAQRSVRKGIARWLRAGVRNGHETGPSRP